jgi:hypothetical protein
LPQVAVLEAFFGHQKLAPILHEIHVFSKFLVLSFATFLMPGKLHRFVCMESYLTFLNILSLVSVADHLLSQNLIARLVQFTFLVAL